MVETMIFNPEDIDYRKTADVISGEFSTVIIPLDRTPVSLDPKKPESVDNFRVAVDKIINDKGKPHLQERIKKAIAKGEDVVAFVSGTGKALMIGAGVAAVLTGAALAGAVIIHQHKEKKD